MVVGELLRLHDGLEWLGAWFQRRLSRGERPSRIAEGFVTASLVFCVGPLTILGSLDNGLRGDLTLASDRIAVERLDAQFDRRDVTGRFDYVFAAGDRPARLDAALKAPELDIDAALGFVIRWFSARIGEGLIYDLRTQVFEHVQRQPIAFFTRAQTGSLVSRLNSDVIGAQQALTSTLSGVVSNVLSLILVLGAMLYLSWLVTVVALVLIPMFIIPARLVGRRLQRLTRESMQLDAEMGTTMTERFNVAGAMLVKLFGRPQDEAHIFAGRAARVRDIGVVTAMYGGALFIALTLLASIATAVVYGLGGSLVINGVFPLGTLVALAALLARLYGPLTPLSHVQGAGMTPLVRFDRVF